MPRPKQADPLGELSPEATITVAEAAERLGVSRKYIQSSIRRGKLVAFLPGKAVTDGPRSGPAGYRIRIDDLRRWFTGR